MSRSSIRRDKAARCIYLTPFMCSYGTSYRCLDSDKFARITPPDNLLQGWMWDRSIAREIELEKQWKREEELIDRATVVSDLVDRHGIDHEVIQNELVWLEDRQTIHELGCRASRLSTTLAQQESELGSTIAALQKECQRLRSVRHRITPFIIGVLVGAAICSLSFP